MAQLFASPCLYFSFRENTIINISVYISTLLNSSLHCLADEFFSIKIAQVWQTKSNHLKMLESN